MRHDFWDAIEAELRNQSNRFEQWLCYRQGSESMIVELMIVDADAQPEPHPLDVLSWCIWCHDGYVMQVIGEDDGAYKKQLDLIAYDIRKMFP